MGLMMIDYNIDGKIVKITPQRDIDAVVSGGDEKISKKSVIDLLDQMIKDISKGRNNEFFRGIAFGLQGAQKHIKDLKN